MLSKINLQVSAILFSLSIILVNSILVNSTWAAPSRKTKPPLIKSLTLIDAISKRPIAGYNPIKSGTVINLATLSTKYINIKANINTKTTKSVRFRMNKGKNVTSTKAPFALAGNKKGEVPNFNPALGLNSLQATPFSLASLKGKKGKNLVLQFTVVNQAFGSNASAAGGVDSISNGVGGTEPSGTVGSGNVVSGPKVTVPVIPMIPAPAIPFLAEWKANMTTFGAQLCNQQNIFDLTTSEGSVWYYDGLRVYRQISNFTNDPSWDACAGYVKNDVYLPYVLGLGRYNDGHVAGNIPGRRIFAEGLYLDFQKTGDPQSAEAIRALATKSSTAYTGGSASPEFSPETAYIIQAYLFAEQLGVALKPQLDKSVNFSLGHLEKLTDGSADFTQPYQLGLTFEALIQYYDRTRDKRIPAAIKKAADLLFADAWNPATGAFYYIKCKSTSANPECSQSDTVAPDLNLLIAPAYAWLWRMTGDSKYLDQADAIWTGGVSAGPSFLVYGKQYSQNYRWSFEYVRYRSAGGSLY